jgi:hypothetical protein
VRGERSGLGAGKAGPRRRGVWRSLVLWVVGLKGEYQAVEGQFKDATGVVDDGGVLRACQRGVALRGKSRLRLAVFFLTAANLAAWGPAGFGERVADEEPPRAPGTVRIRHRGQGRLRHCVNASDVRPDRYGRISHPA